MENEMETTILRHGVIYCKANSLGEEISMGAGEVICVRNLLCWSVLLAFLDFAFQSKGSWGWMMVGSGRCPKPLGPCCEP